MKKIAILVVVLIVSGLLLIGCGREGSGNQDQPATEPMKTEEPPKETEKEEQPSGSSAADSYSAYLDAKSELISSLSDAILNDPAAGTALLSFLQVTVIDMAMWPAAFLGQGEATAVLGMGYLGIEGVDYQSAGNESRMVYLDTDGKEAVFAGNYDDKADWYTITLKVEGKETLYSEYRRISYGYAGQYYIINEDGTTTRFWLTIEGRDGAVGFDSEASRPSPLTGNEGPDFPKSAPEWYAIKGNTVTGVTSEGNELNFEIP